MSFPAPVIGKNVGKEGLKLLLQHVDRSNETFFVKDPHYFKIRFSFATGILVGIHTRTVPKLPMGAFVEANPKPSERIRWSGGF